ncbi:hypothetical protein D3C72_1833020 [compost metagenome]
MNNTWARARRCPARAPPRAPITAVTVLPIFEPMAIAKPCSSASWPPARAVRVSIRVAWLDCSRTVISKPTPVNSRCPAMPGIW